jgi:hypothetical protein
VQYKMNHRFSSQGERAVSPAAKGAVNQVI